MWTSTGMPLRSLGESETGGEPSAGPADLLPPMKFFMKYHIIAARMRPCKNPPAPRCCWLFWPPAPAAPAAGAALGMLKLLIWICSEGWRREKACTCQPKSNSVKGNLLKTTTTEICYSIYCVG